MPSGAKKRKAAKKKKENQPNNNPSSSTAPTHAHRDDDVKHHDDRESDVGEVSSPTSQDHQNLLTERKGEVIENESKLSDLPSVVRIESGEKHVAVEDSAVQVERVLKIEDELDKKHGRVEHDETMRKPYDGGSLGSSSSSSSSDDENQGIKNGPAELDIASVDSVKVADSLSGKSVDAIDNSPITEADVSVGGETPAANSEKISLSDRQAEVDVSSPADISVAPYAVESAFKENGEKKSVENQICKLRKEEAAIQSGENTATTSDLKECVAPENHDRSTLPYNAPRATADNGAEQMKDSVVSQPVLAPSPYSVQKTSWKSCCGLFELFSGSGA